MIFSFLWEPQLSKEKQQAEFDILLMFYYEKWPPSQQGLGNSYQGRKVFSSLDKEQLITEYFF